MPITKDVKKAAKATIKDCTQKAQNTTYILHEARITLAEALITDNEQQADQAREDIQDAKAYMTELEIKMAAANFILNPNFQDTVPTEDYPPDTQDD